MALVDPKVGDRVRSDPILIPSHGPEYRGKVGTITAVNGPYHGQGDRLFVDVRFDGDSKDTKALSSTSLIPA